MIAKSELVEKNSRVADQLAVRPLNLLLVDDEVEILHSLKRLTRGHAFKIYTAANGLEAIDILNSKKINIVITDIKMPQMDGHALLNFVTGHYPKIYRIVLTGFAELSSIKETVNKGNIDNYIDKPWDNNSLMSILLKARQSIINRHVKATKINKLVSKHSILTQKHRSLANKLLEKNQQLTKLDDHRSESILNHSKAFMNVVSVCSHIDEHFAKNVSMLCVALGEKLSLDKRELTELSISGYLVELGMLEVDRSISKCPINKMSCHHYSAYVSQVEYVEKILARIDSFKDIEYTIRSQFLRYNPANLDNDRLAHAQILSIARDICLLLSGRMTGQNETEYYLRQYICKHKGGKYAPFAVDAALSLEHFQTVTLQNAIELSVNDLISGMKLKNNVYSSTHRLLYRKNLVLTAQAINKLKSVERNSGRLISLEVHANEIL
jgi:response regulator RpfG family c-di-GMP phosphodiesterase